MTSVYQQDIFAELYPKFVIDKPIRLIEMFAGIGSQSTALERLGVEYEAWKVVEFDKYCIKSYNAIHHTQFETSDIRDVHAADLEIVERDKYCYILTYSFPCQDLSASGHQKGMKKGSGTRSGLLWEVERILDECHGDLPHVLLMENVPMVIAKKNIEDFYEGQKDNTVVVLLIPARTDTKWFHNYIQHRSEIRFIKGRLRFSDSTYNAPFPSMVVIFRGAEK